MRLSGRVAQEQRSPTLQAVVPTSEEESTGTPQGRRTPGRQPHRTVLAPRGDGPPWDLSGWTSTCERELPHEQNSATYSTWVFWPSPRHCCCLPWRHCTLRRAKLGGLTSRSSSPTIWATAICAAIVAASHPEVVARLSQPHHEGAAHAVEGVPLRRVGRMGIPGPHRDRLTDIVQGALPIPPIATAVGRRVRVA